MSGDYIPMEPGIPDVNEPATGYLWGNLARHGLSYRHYGELSPPGGATTSRRTVRRRAGLPRGIRHLPAPGGEAGRGPAAKSGWRQEPLSSTKFRLIAYDAPTKPELKDHFDPNFADFKVEYPDQFRADEFLREFGFVQARQNGTGRAVTATSCCCGCLTITPPAPVPDSPTPNASVADNDLAVGRVVEAVSNSPYWADTAIFVFEDDAQDGADHVDAHRSIALVISKYSPGTPQQPAVDHHFYTTVNMIHTMEVLLGLPPMNNNDAYAPVMAPLFTGAGEQPAFKADYRNRDNGMIYQANAARCARS